MTNLSGIIKSIQNIMRQDGGVDGDAQRLSQLCWMLFLKMFDEKEEETELLNPQYKSPIPQNLRWRNWAKNNEGITGDNLLNFINNDLFPKLKGLNFSIQENEAGFVVKSVFEDSYNYMKSGTQIRKVINKINEINFNRKADQDQFGLIYENLLSSLQSAGNAGEYYTPRALTKFIVDIIDPKLGEKVFDPACGTGGFLTSVIEHIRKNDVHTVEDEKMIKQTVSGTEFKQLPHMLCTTNMMLHGILAPTNISRDDSLSRPIKDIGTADKVNIIVANPPFGGSVKDGILTNFPKNYQTKETADLFLVLFMKLLKDQGRAGIVLPDGSLTGDGVKARIREDWLKECNLHTIIRLPNSVFAPYATVATNLLFFTKGTPTKEIWYYEHRLPESQKAYSKTKPIDAKEFEPIKKWWHNRVESDVAWKVGIKEIEARNFDLDIKNPSKKEELQEFTSAELIKMLEDSFDETKKILAEIRGVL
jgi:type I restriction enzyme M protein